MPNQKKIRRLRSLHAKAQGGRCFWCNIEMTEPHPPGIALTYPPRGTVYVPTSCTLDHLVRQVSGGTDTEENTCAACRRCNNSRHWDYFPEKHPREGATIADKYPELAGLIADLRDGVQTEIAA